MLSQLVQEMRVGSHIPYRRSESGWPVLGSPARVVGQRPFLRTLVRGLLSPWASRFLSGDPGSAAFTGPLCLQSSTTWKGGTPCSSSTAGPRAWTLA